MLVMLLRTSFGNVVLKNLALKRAHIVCPDTYFTKWPIKSKLKPRYRNLGFPVTVDLLKKF